MKSGRQQHTFNSAGEMSFCFEREAHGRTRKLAKVRDPCTGGGEQFMNPVRDGMPILCRGEVEVY
jgi:hypothetical protein